MDTVGLQYKNLTKSQIDEHINNYIDSYIESHKSRLFEAITDMLITYQNKAMDEMSPAMYLEHLKNQLMSISADFKNNKHATNGNRMIKKYIANYV